MDKEYCKICGKVLTAKDTYLNVYKICIKCLDNDKLNSLKEQVDKRRIDND